MATESWGPVLPERRDVRRRLDALRKGEPGALGALLDTLAPWVRLMVAARIRSFAERLPTVEDTAQDVLAELARELGGRPVEDEAALRELASRIVTERAAGVPRRGVRLGAGVPSPVAAVADVAAIPALWNEVASDGPTGRGCEAFATLLAELHRMPERPRTAVLLAYFDGLGPTQVGDVLGLPRAAAVHAIGRATNDLRRRWQRSRERPAGG